MKVMIRKASVVFMTTILSIISQTEIWASGSAKDLSEFDIPKTYKAPQLLDGDLENLTKESMSYFISFETLIEKANKLDVNAEKFHENFNSIWTDRSIFRHLFFMPYFNLRIGNSTMFGTNCKGVSMFSPLEDIAGDTLGEMVMKPKKISIFDQNFTEYLLMYKTQAFSINLSLIAPKLDFSLIKIRELMSHRISSSLKLESNPHNPKFKTSNVIDCLGNDSTRLYDHRGNEWQICKPSQEALLSGIRESALSGRIGPNILPWVYFYSGNLQFIQNNETQFSKVMSEKFENNKIYKNIILEARDPNNDITSLYIPIIYNCPTDGGGEFLWTTLQTNLMLDLKSEKGFSDIDVLLKCEH